MKHKLVLAATAALAIFIITIIVIADHGDGNRLWGSFINRIPYGDKVGHVVLMGGLCFLCNLALRVPSRWFLPRHITPVTFVLFLLISLEEISQAYSPYRTCDWYDWLADLAGLAIGQSAAVWIHSRRKNNR